MDFAKAVKYSSEAATVADCYSYLDCDAVIIDRYVPSRLESGNVSLAQDELPGGGTVIFFDREYYGTLALRIPDDPSVKTMIYINGDEYDYATAPGEGQALYALVGGPFEPGCRVKLEIKMPERVKVIPHNPTMRISPVSTSNGTVRYNDGRSRYLLTLEVPAELVTFTLPDSYDIELNGKECGSSVELILGDTLFTSYKMRVFTEGHSSYRDFDLVIMQAAPDSDLEACAVNAYAPITGAFAGEACYILDRRSNNSENATHGNADDPMLAIDPVTGYKWGRVNPDKTEYYFELENGGYEISASFTGEGARLVANPGTEYEKVLVRETTKEVQRYGMRVTDGQLILSVCEGDPGIDFLTLTIRAIDTIASESGYEMEYDGRKNQPVQDDEDYAEAEEEEYGDDGYFEESFGADSEYDREEYTEEFGIDGEYGEAAYTGIPAAGYPDGKGNETAFTGGTKTQEQMHMENSTRTVSVKPSSPKISVSKSSSVTEKRNTATQNYINNKLAVKKNADAKKTLGIAAGALAVAGGIIALLSRDKK